MSTTVADGAPGRARNRVFAETSDGVSTVEKPTTPSPDDGHGDGRPTNHFLRDAPEQEP